MAVSENKNLSDMALFEAPGKAEGAARECTDADMALFTPAPAVQHAEKEPKAEATPLSTEELASMALFEPGATANDAAAVEPDLGDLALFQSR